MSLLATIPVATPSLPPVSPATAPELLDSLHQHRALQTELQRQGFVQAGHHAGHPEALYTQLEALYESYRHTNSREWMASEQQRREVLGRIRELETQAAELERAGPAANAVLEARRVVATERAAQLRQRLEQVREEVLDLPPRNWPLLGLLAVVLTALTAALYLFYAGTAFRAFTRPSWPRPAVARRLT
ncbi:hypothetical protein D0N36_02105 [Hymenobacter lapidiphilus]|uniref:hypothetical protein n=1 Tax=Hymenobacter sp. CCM 8763 TaxID=2303334 RepID=UPI000E35627C|nr:hypothetical protein [Hymenobacter sp. CCM 8763]RFP66898.1 hypothetical protein D0N36_02105 [Hymenobacter sp. CCM 8763]